MRFTVFDGSSATAEAVARWANGFNSTVEEFWNDCHSKADGRFCKTGTRGSRTVAPGPDERLVRAIRKSGGATLDFHNNMAPIRSGFAVGVRPAKSAAFPMNKLGKQQIKSWLQEHKDTLQQPGMHVGAWHDKKTGKVWLDIVRVYPNSPKGRRLAMRAAGRHKQIAIYHLDTDKEIEKRNAAALRSEEPVTAASGPRYSKAARQVAAKSGEALPNGKFPIRNVRELHAAVRRRHQTNEPAAKVNAHIVRRAAALGAPLHVKLSTGEMLEFGRRSAKAQAARRMSPKSVGGGRDPSLKWPWLYDLLREKGYDKSKAAAISNSRVGFRKKGRLNVLNYKQADNMTAVRRAMHKPA